MNGHPEHHMSSLEKQQVTSFLKILQIPTNLSLDEIKQSLLDAGWNEADAEEAVTVLNPHSKQAVVSDGSQEDSPAVPSTPQSQIVAQRYVQNKASAIEKQSVVSSTQDSNLSEAGVSTVPETMNDTDQANDEALQIARAIEQERVSKEVVNVDVERPHVDAPWLEHQVDIYDVTPEEREEMIRTVYRTNEKLNPQTIHALFGIDVDLSDFEHDYRKRHASTDISWLQITIILALSLLLAGLGFFAGLYYFEVGPFHPSLNS